MHFKAQGTIEYLVILAVVVVIALVVVSLMINSTVPAAGISSGVSKLSTQSAPISIVDASINPDGNVYLKLGNNIGENIEVTQISVEGETIALDTVVSMGSEQGFVIPTSIVCTEGSSAAVSVEIRFDWGQYNLSGFENYDGEKIVVNCEDTIIADHTVVVTPIQVYAVTMNLRDAFDGLPLSNFDIDCDGTAYDLSGQSLFATIDFNSGSYTCSFSKTGYDSNAIFVDADSNKSVDVYLADSLMTYANFSSCGTLSTSGGYYLLDNDIGSGGPCLTITTDNVRINGNGFTITGDIIASNVSGAAYSGLKIQDTIVNGTVESIGGDNTGTVAFAGGSITITNSDIPTITTIGGTGGWEWGQAYNVGGGAGGAVTAYNSTISTITTTGGDGLPQSFVAKAGGRGGDVNIIDSLVTTITATGGLGGSSGNTSGSGGYGGDVIVTDSTASTISTTAGGSGSGYRGGDGFDGGDVTVTGSIVGTINTLGSRGGDGSWFVGKPGSGGDVIISGSGITRIDANAGLFGTGGSLLASTASGGAVTIASSTISTIYSVGTGGGSGGNVFFNPCPVTEPFVSNEGGSSGGASGTITPPDCHNP